MSISLHIGQCGIEIGHQTLKNLHTHAKYHPDEISPIFSYCQNNLVPNTLLIDTEEKVIDNYFKTDNNINYQNKVSAYSGSGNNWSLGFHKNAPKAKEEIFNSINSIAEKMDSFNNFINLHSLAGGTGSGLGTKLSIWLKDEFGRKKSLFTTVITPQSDGDICVQSFNSVLTLANLESDAIFLLNNDDYYKIVKKRINNINPSLNDINQVMGQHLAQILLPPSDLGDILKTCIPLPSYNLLSLKSVPQVNCGNLRFQNFDFGTLMKYIYQMDLTGNPVEENINWSLKSNSKGTVKSHGSYLITRGHISNYTDFHDDVSNIFTNQFNSVHSNNIRKYL